MPSKGGTLEHENYSPPLEGCRGGLFRDGKDPPRKAEAFFPLPERGFSWESMPPTGFQILHSFRGVQGDVLCDEARRDPRPPNFFTASPPP